MPNLDFIPDESISFIRFIRSNRKLDFLGECFAVAKDLVYSCVGAEIVTKLHAIRLYLENEIVDTFEYHPSDSLLPGDSVSYTGKLMS